LKAVKARALDLKGSQNTMTPPKITLILAEREAGKARKPSNWPGPTAENRFHRHGHALGQGNDPKIDRHRKSRPSQWKTFEEPLEAASLLKNLGSKFDLVVIDCLTLLLSNHLLRGDATVKLKNEVRQMILALKEAPFRSVVVSNEVGLGVVPAHPLGSVLETWRDGPIRLRQKMRIRFYSWFRAFP